jgi:FkbM family methyltransferase
MSQDTVADIGANIGYYTLIAARIVKKVYAFEPEPGNLELLRRNVELNSLGNCVVLCNAAVGNKTEKALLRVADRNTIEHRLEFSPTTHQHNCIEIETVTIDDFFKDAPPDVIRMDIEGAEWLAVKSMTNILESHKPLRLFIEVHPRFVKDYGGDAIALLDYLIDSGLKIRYLVEDIASPEPPRIRYYFRGKDIPFERVIGTYPSPGATIIDDEVSEILANSTTFRVFMEK